MKLSHRIAVLLLALLAYAGGAGAERVRVAELDVAPHAAALTGDPHDVRPAFLASGAPVVEAAAGQTGSPLRLGSRLSRDGDPGLTRVAAPAASRARALRLEALRFAAALAAAATHRSATWSNAPPRSLRA